MKGTLVRSVTWKKIIKLWFDSLLSSYAWRLRTLDVQDETQGSSSCQLQEVLHLAFSLVESIMWAGTLSELSLCLNVGLIAKSIALSWWVTSTAFSLSQCLYLQLFFLQYSFCSYPYFKRHNFNAWHMDALLSYVWTYCRKKLHSLGIIKV